MHYGAGIGIGIVAGDILRTSNNPAAPRTNAGDPCAVQPGRLDCLESASATNCRSSRCLPARSRQPRHPHRFADPNVPSVLPIVNIVVGFDFRLPQVRGWEAKSKAASTSPSSSAAASATRSSRSAGGRRRPPTGSQVDAGAAEPRLPLLNPLAMLALTPQRPTGFPERIGWLARAPTRVDGAPQKIRADLSSDCGGSWPLRPPRATARRRGGRRRPRGCTARTRVRGGAAAAPAWPAGPAVSTLRSSLKRSSWNACRLTRLASMRLIAWRGLRRRDAGRELASDLLRDVAALGGQRHLLLVVFGEDREQPRRRALVQLQLLDDPPRAQRAHPLQHLLAQLLRVPACPPDRGGRRRAARGPPRPARAAVRRARPSPRGTATSASADERPPFSDVPASERSMRSSAGPSSSASSSFSPLVFVEQRLRASLPGQRGRLRRPAARNRFEQLAQRRLVQIRDVDRLVGGLVLVPACAISATAPATPRRRTGRLRPPPTSTTTPRLAATEATAATPGRRQRHQAGRAGCDDPPPRQPAAAAASVVRAARSSQNRSPTADRRAGPRADGRQPRRIAQLRRARGSRSCTNRRAPPRRRSMFDGIHPLRTSTAQIVDLF